MAAKKCDCMKRDVCVFYFDGDYPQVCKGCGLYIMKKGFTLTNSAMDAIAALTAQLQLPPSQRDWNEVGRIRDVLRQQHQ